jgi:hypothetical protein
MHNSGAEALTTAALAVTIAPTDVWAKHQQAYRDNIKNCDVVSAARAVGHIVQPKAERVHRCVV